MRLLQCCSWMPEVVDLSTDIADQSSAKQRSEATLRQRMEAKEPKLGPVSVKIAVDPHSIGIPEALKLRNCFFETQMMVVTSKKFWSNESRDCPAGQCDGASTKFLYFRVYRVYVPQRQAFAGMKPAMYDASHTRRRAIRRRMRV